MALGRDVVQDNVEYIVKSYYGADDAIATVESSDEDQNYILDVWYSGDLHRSLLPYTYDEPSSMWIQRVAITEAKDDNHIEVYFSASKGDGSIPIDGFKKRWKATETDYPRVLIHGDVAPEEIERASKLTDHFESYVYVAHTTGEDLSLGYIGEYDVITVCSTNTITEDKIDQAIENFENATLQTTS